MRSRILAGTLLATVAIALASFVLTAHDALGEVTSRTSRVYNVRRVDVSYANMQGETVITGKVPYAAGELLRVIVWQGRGTGATYKVTVVDEAGIDLLSGLGVNMPTNVIRCVGPSCVATDGSVTNIIPHVFHCELRIIVDGAASTNANTASGKVTLLYRE